MIFVNERELLDSDTVIDDHRIGVFNPLIGTRKYLIWKLKERRERIILHI